MDSSLILWALFLGIAAEYAVRCMMLIERDSHEGPFQSSKDTRYVRFESTGHIQKVSLFDRIRRLFRVYRIHNDFGQEEWVVDERREQVQRFTCPHCLSWWVCLPFSLGLTFAFFGASVAFLVWFFPVHFFIAVVAQIAYKVLWSED